MKTVLLLGAASLFIGVTARTLSHGQERTCQRITKF